MNTAPPSVSDTPTLPTLEELAQRVRNLEQLTKLLTERRRATDGYNPTPPCK